MKRELPDEQMGDQCPACGDNEWTDSGQARTIVPFRRSRSLVSRLEASTVDDSDDRQEEYYEVETLISVVPENYSGARLIDSLPFGYELLTNVILREINFGKQASAGANGFKVGGEPIGAQGFEVCKHCGRVRDGGVIRHHATCPTRRNNAAEQTESIFLYREIQSEAIRVLLPVSAVDLEDRRASFKAALQLGFRRHFEGDPGHLIVRSAREPVPGSHGSRQYLVIMDGVPGGTGYLRELWQKDHFLKVLEKALAALESCSCQKDAHRDGCYRCLYAYQSQQELSLISSREAQNTLREILGQREKLVEVTTLSDVSIESKLESELETKFLQALKNFSQSIRGFSWQETVHNGDVRWLLTTPQREWEIRAQVDLGSSEGVSPACRPDFIIAAANADPDIKPIAVFLDGLAYHACPDQEIGRIGDDIEKRSGILKSGKYNIWSVTWKDVEDFEAKPSSAGVSVLFKSVDADKVAHSMGVTIDRSIGQRGSMGMLLAFLQHHSPQQWEKLARSYALTWLLGAQQWLSPEDGSNLENRLTEDIDPAETDSQPSVGKSAPVLTHAVSWSHGAALARSPVASLGRGHVERFVLRLFDRQPDRQAAQFEAGWRKLLQAWNLLQFMDGLEVTSSERLLDQVGEDADTSEAGPGPDLTTQEPTEHLSDLLQLVTAESKPLVAAVHAAGLPLPDVDYELPAPGPGVGPEPDLAWVDLKVAVLSFRQAVDKPVFESQDWHVFVHPFDDKEVVAYLVGALSASGRNGRAT
jgi:DEAD/DEAH box helicase domain-containing protein